MRRVLVTGSRTWPRDAEHSNTILRALAEFPTNSTVIVHGACQTGADAEADFYAGELGLEVERHPADWKRFGPSAGPRRNREMVESLDPARDLVLAFWDGSSRGTAGTIELARARGITVRVFRQ